jgi:hypothetical protein
MNSLNRVQRELERERACHLKCHHVALNGAPGITEEHPITFPPTYHTPPAMPDWEQCEGNDEVLPVTHHNE